MKHNFEIKKKIVLAGDSEVFKKWKEFVPSLTQEDFLSALEWLCNDPCENGDEMCGRLTRRIGLTREGIVRIKSVNGRLTTLYRLDNHMLWTGDCFLVPCEKYVKNGKDAIKMGYADKNGMISLRFDIRLCARDRV